MISDAANRLAGLVSIIALQTRAAVAGMKAVVRMRGALFAAIVVTLTLAQSTAARAATIMVDSLADIGVPAGICVLRDAITAANTKAAVHGCVAGDGNDTINFSVTGTILLGSTLPQITDTQLTINGPAAPGITIDGGSAVQVMAVATGATVNLNDLTVAHGSARSSGGIENEGTLTVTASTFSANSANGSLFPTGGGIENRGTLNIANSTFSGNSARFYGGGIGNEGPLTITNTTFSANRAGDSGGGIANEGPLTITNSTFSANRTSGYGGGGIYNGSGTATITNGIFSANRASVHGGGIDNEGTLTVTNSTFSGNSAGDGGSIRNGGTLTVTNGTFSANRAGFGGGIENGNGFYSALTVTNSTFFGNSASEAGGIDNGEGGVLTVTNSTFSGNRVRFFGDGGAVLNEAVASLKSTILAASSGGNCSNFGGITDAGYNISDDSSCRFRATGSLNSTDPMLDRAGLSNNGGPTQTIALLSGSPAIDAIPLADCTDQASPPNPVITDQRFFPRPDAGETNCDIGAYEFADTPFVAFSRFRGHLTIRANQTVFDLGGRFKLGTGGNIDPTTQPVAFSVGSYAVRLPVGSFVNYNSGYIYQKRVNGIFLWLFIKFSGTPDTYILRAYRRGGTVPNSGSPVPVTLTIGDNSGSTQMMAKFQ